MTTTTISNDIPGLLQRPGPGSKKLASSTIRGNAFLQPAHHEPPTRSKKPQTNRGKPSNRPDDLIQIDSTYSNLDDGSVGNLDELWASIPGSATQNVTPPTFVPLYEPATAFGPEPASNLQAKTAQPQVAAAAAADQSFSTINFEDLATAVVPVGEPAAAPVLQLGAETAEQLAEIVAQGDHILTTDSFEDLGQIDCNMVYPDQLPSDDETFWRIDEHDLNLPSPTVEPIFAIQSSNLGFALSNETSLPPIHFDPATVFDEIAQESQSANLTSVDTVSVSTSGNPEPVVVETIEPDLVEVRNFEAADQNPGSDQLFQELEDFLDQTLVEKATTSRQDVTSEGHDQLLDYALAESDENFDLPLEQEVPEIVEVKFSTTELAMDPVAAPAVATDPPIKRGRGRPRLIRDTPPVSVSPKRRGRPPLLCSGVPLPPIPRNCSKEDKYRRDRDLNNEASRRCRQNRKRKQEAVFTELEEQEAKNLRLLTELSLKKTKIANLRRLISACHQRDGILHPSACDVCSKRLPPEDHAA